MLPGFSAGRNTGPVEPLAGTISEELSVPCHFVRSEKIATAVEDAKKRISPQLSAISSVRHPTVGTLLKVPA